MKALTKLIPTTKPIDKVDEEIQRVSKRVRELNGRHKQNLAEIPILQMRHTQLAINAELDGANYGKELSEIDLKIKRLDKEVELHPNIISELERRLAVLSEKKNSLVAIENTDGLKRLARVLNKRTKKLVALLTDADNLNDKIKKDRETFLKLYGSVERPPENLPCHACSNWALKRLLCVLKDLLNGGEGKFEISFPELNSRLL